MECPNENMLAALVVRELGAEAHAVVTAHVDVCELCQVVLIAAVRGGAQAAQTPERMAEGTPRRISDTDLGQPVARGQLGAGDRMGRFELRHLLGAGGMGRVYEAFDPELDRAIALKVMRSELVGRGDFAERVLRESRMMAKLAHPSVITVYDVGRTGDAVFIAMELIRGETLGAYVRRAQPGWRDIAALLARASEGIEAAHAAGIVHRDLKPDNVLVEVVDDHVKRVLVTDFGIARASGAEPVGAPSVSAAHIDLTSPGTAIGTPAYMPPEQLDGAVVDERADVFAFAVTAWEMLFGERPFRGATAAELRAAIETPPRPPSRTNVPRRLSTLLVRALSADPQARGRLQTLHAELLRVTTRPSRRRWVTGVSLIAVAGAVFVATRREPALDPCAASAQRFADDLSARQLSIATTFGTHAVAIQRIAVSQRQWLSTHAETCTSTATPVQSPKVVACLEARRQELLGTIDELVQSSANSEYVVAFIGNATRCSSAGIETAPGLLTARVPADPEARHRVTELRRKLFAAEAARDRGDSSSALALADEVAAEAQALYPPLEAEAKYISATTQSMLGETAKAGPALRETAALAERVHADYIAANVWLRLAHSSTFDDGDPQRGLEYVGYAIAAAERIANPPDLFAMLEYTRGTILVEADRGAEGEKVLRALIATAKTTAPEIMPQVVQGLGYYYEDALRIPEAVATYREALELLATQPQVPNVEVILRERLATCLSMLGQLEEAEAQARAAIALAERTMEPTNTDRVLTKLYLAQIVEKAGRLEEALALVHEVSEGLRELLGSSSERYGEVLVAEALVLTSLDRQREAAAMFDRACAILAASLGDDSVGFAECWLNAAESYIATGRTRAVIAALERHEPILVKAYGPDHPQVAILLMQRGRLTAGEQRTRAISDLTRAVSILEAHPLESGQLALARYNLGIALWPVDREKARSLVRAAVAGFATATPDWKDSADQASAWLAARERSAGGKN